MSRRWEPSLPYRRARTLLAEFLPLDDIPSVETARQRTIRVGARLEKEAVSSAQAAEASPAEAKSIALSIDGGHVRSVREYQVRSFEVLLAQVTNDEGKQVVFSSVPAEAISQQDQLRGVLHKLGATAVTPVTILSDGAEGPRALGEAASPGPTHHVLDWFHLSMRIQHVDQAAKSWPDVSADDRRTGADLVEIIDRIRWRLWHGQVVRALDLIGETLVTLDGVANGKDLAAVAARKVARLSARSRDIYLWTIRYHHRLRHGTPPGRADFDGGHGKYRAVAVAPANERTAAHALVTTRRSSDAEGSDRERQWDA